MKKILIIVGLLVIIHSKQLLMIQQTFRHGARYPLFFSQSDYSNELLKEHSDGQLTSQGKHMHYVLGKLLYEKYWAQLFNNTPYMEKYNQTQFYVKSTDVNRTIESVESQIFGLLQQLPPLQLDSDSVPFSNPAWKGYKPQHNSSVWNVYKSGPVFHPIPIHVEKKGADACDEGDFLRGYDEKNCPNQVYWQEENFNDELTETVKNNEEVKVAIKALSEALGKQITFEDVYMYKDTATCLKYLNLKYLPIFDDPAYSKTFDFIETYSMYQLYSKDFQIKAVATNFVKRTLSNLQGKVNNTFTPRIVLYSAHDTTVGMVLAAFNMTNMNCIVDHYLNGVNNSDTCVWWYPIYSSNIIIELWKDQNIFSFKIMYNGQYRKIPFCGYEYECSFQRFKSWHDEFIIDDVGIACGLDEPQTPFIGIIISLVIMLLICGGYLAYVKFGRKKLMNNEVKGYEENFEEKEQELPNKQ